MPNTSLALISRRYILFSHMFASLFISASQFSRIRAHLLRASASRNLLRQLLSCMPPGYLASFRPCSLTMPIFSSFPFLLRPHTHIHTAATSLACYVFADEASRYISHIYARTPSPTFVAGSRACRVITSFWPPRHFTYSTITHVYASAYAAYYQHYGPPILFRLLMIFISL